MCKNFSDGLTWLAMPDIMTRLTIIEDPLQTDGRIRKLFDKIRVPKKDGRPVYYGFNTDQLARFFHLHLPLETHHFNASGRMRHRGILLDEVRLQSDYSLTIPPEMRVFMEKTAFQIEQLQVRIAALE
jgi:hypothetical protein